MSKHLTAWIGAWLYAGFGVMAVGAGVGRLFPTTHWIVAVMLIAGGVGSLWVASYDIHSTPPESGGEDDG